MRTTLAFPDPLVLSAKQLALVEGTTLTDLLIQGLEWRLKKARLPTSLPVSMATGGLVSGVHWLALTPASPEDEVYR